MARNVLVKKIKIWAVEKIISLDFAECISYSKVQKKSKVVNVKGGLRGWYKIVSLWTNFVMIWKY